MSDLFEPTAELDRLLNAIEAVTAPSADTAAATAIAPSGDAIDIERRRPRRATAVTPLRDAPETIAFRQALIDGFVRTDTVNRLLRLIHEVILPAVGKG